MNQSSFSSVANVKSYFAAASNNNSILQDQESQDRNSVFSSPNTYGSPNRFLFLKKIISIANKTRKLSDSPLTSPVYSSKAYNYFKKYQRIMYLVLEQPMGSALGKFILGFVLMGIAINVTEAIIIPHQQMISPSIALICLNSIVLMIFLIELALRLISATAFGQRLPQVILRPLIFIDFIAIASLLLDIVSSQNQLENIQRNWSIQSLLKMLTILKLLRYVDKSYIFVKGLKQSLASLGFLTLMIIIANFVFATMVYYAEKSHPSSRLNTGIPTALWWCIVTMTTVGYGDVVPITPIGKIIGSMVGIFGMVLLTLPVVILGYHFQEVYNQMQEEELVEKLKSEELLNSSHLTENQKETHFLKIRINNVESSNRDIMSLLEDSEEVYRDVSGDLKSLFSTIYVRSRKSSVREIDTMGYKIKVMKKIMRPTRKIQLTEIFKDGFRRLRSLSESDVQNKLDKKQDEIIEKSKPKYSNSVDMTRKLLKKFEQRGSLRQDLPKGGSESDENLDDSGDVSSDSAEFVSKPSTLTSKPSLLLLDRLKTLESRKKRKSLYCTTIQNGLVYPNEPEANINNQHRAFRKKHPTTGHRNSQVGLLDSMYEKRNSFFSNSPSSFIKNKFDCGDNSPYQSLSSLKHNARRESISVNAASKQRFKRNLNAFEYSLSGIQVESHDFESKFMYPTSQDLWDKHKDVA